MKTPTTSLIVNDVTLELIDRGSGSPILFLHPWIGLAPDLPILDSLAEQGRLLAPSHPGFGASTLPRHFSNVDDIAYLYLEMLEQLDLRDVTVVGVSFGAWIAVQMAIKSTERIARLVLAAPVGVKLGDRETACIADHFALSNDDFNKLAYADPARAGTALADIDAEDAMIVARNRDATALFGWSPYMYDPKLGDRLFRVKRPVLLLNGSEDRVLSAGYVNTLAAMLPAARCETIDDCGHFPHIEQPAALASAVQAFCN